MIKYFTTLALLAAMPLAHANIRNASLDRTGIKPPVQKDIENWRGNGLVCPDAKDWPHYWFSSKTKGGKIEFSRQDSVRGVQARLTQPAMIRGYHGLKLKGDIVLEIYLRGKGIIWIGFWNYGKNEAGKIKFIPATKGVRSQYITLNSDVWTRYTLRFPVPAAVNQVHPFFAAYKGTVELDELFLRNPAKVYLLLADMEKKLEGKKLIVRNQKEIVLDADAAKFTALYKRQDAALKTFAEKNKDNADAQALYKLSTELRPYILTDGVKTIKVDLWNRMNVISAAAAAVMKKDIQFPGSSVIKAPAAAKQIAVKKDTDAKIKITAIKPNRIRYNEGQKGSARYTIHNRTNQPVSGTVVIKMGYDINSERLIRKTNVTLNPGANTFTVNYAVGPETFGRELSITFKGKKPEYNAAAKEYFQVAKEYMRVMMHGTGKYQNFSHFFASETSDFGVKKTDDLEYLSAQPRYHMRWKGRKGILNHRKNGMGHILSFYQAKAFAAQQGIEEVRKHPEYILYDENGQPARDFYYGGVPDPFEIASPIEINKERRKKLLDGRKFLDVRISGWHHYIPDFMNKDCIEYATKCIRDYQKATGFDVVYLDNTPTITVGYTWQGKQNIAGMTPVQIANANAEITKAWNSGLRKENPDAGSWCNGVSPASCRWQRGNGRWVNTAGMGIDTPEFKDPNDNYIKAMTSFYNIALLAEIQHVFVPSSNLAERNPDAWLNRLLEHRDYLVQKYKSTVVYGYIATPYKGPKPMPRNAYWPTTHYFLALTAATQHHHIIYSHAMPARDAFDQFMTRYSALLWSKDIIVKPAKAAEKMISVASKEKLLWKDFVYTRKQDNKEAVIMHLVRPYPLKKWDLEWNIPATILKDVKVTMTIPAGKKPVFAKAMRPNLPEEKDQIVEHILPMTVNGNKVTVSIPAFSYYTMLAMEYK